jgi:hypothetical protein
LLWLVGERTFSTNPAFDCIVSLTAVSAGIGKTYLWSVWQPSPGYCH